ncbi:unnamed protein product [Cuscuta epithymum]|uniref:Uncharacterized protein n=1 Tax=Cuscuta epithymum TaxID=186058 RepID=A0AAV0E221_9ASTE|nr:unnamed protein product [Cuscuta epithymum]
MTRTNREMVQIFLPLRSKIFCGHFRFDWFPGYGFHLLNFWFLLPFPLRLVSRLWFSHSELLVAAFSGMPQLYYFFVLLLFDIIVWYYFFGQLIDEILCCSYCFRLKI